MKKNFSSLYIFDRRLLRQRRSFLTVDYISKTRLYRYLSQVLTERLSLVRKSFKNVLILGDYLPPPDLFLGNCWHISMTNQSGQILFDDEFLPFGKANFDLIISFMEMHYFNDILGFLQQVKYCLQPDGLFIGVMLGQDTLWQLRHAAQTVEEQVHGGISPRVIPMMKITDAAALMQRAGFTLPVIDMDRIEINYETSHALLQELKQTGLSNVMEERSKSICRKEFLSKLERFYKDQYITHQNKIKATFTPIYMNGWGPSEEQPKALKPGSATVKLVDFLGI